MGNYSNQSYCTSCGWIEKCLFCPTCGQHVRNNRRYKHEKRTEMRRLVEHVKN